MKHPDNGDNERMIPVGEAFGRLVTIRSWRRRHIVWWSFAGRSREVFGSQAFYFRCRL
jgi:hypothetical protein